MLILQRKQGESVRIGDEIEITVLAVEAGKVRLAIDAPKSLSILRSELIKAMDANRESAQEQALPTELLEFLDGMITPTVAQPKNND